MESIWEEQLNEGSAKYGFDMESNSPYQIHVLSIECP